MVNLLYFPVCKDKVHEMLNEDTTEYSSDTNRDNYYKYPTITCPCHSMFFIQAYTDKDGTILHRDMIVKEAFKKLFIHIEHKICASGSIEHINILIDMIGLENTILMLKKWSERNNVIGEVLKSQVIMLNSRKDKNE